MLKKIIMMAVAMILCLGFASNTLAESNSGYKFIDNAQKQKFFELADDFNYKGVEVFLDPIRKRLTQQMSIAVGQGLSNEELQTLKSECTEWREITIEAIERISKRPIIERMIFGRSIDTTLLQTGIFFAAFASYEKVLVGAEKLKSEK